MFASQLEIDDAFVEEKLENNLLPHLNTLELKNFSSTQYNCFNNSFNQTKVASNCVEQSFKKLKNFPKLFTSIYHNNILIPQQFIVKGEPEKLSTILNSVSSLFPSSSNSTNDEFKHALSNSVKKNSDIITNSAVCIKRVVNPNYLLDNDTKNKIYSENLLKTDFQDLTTSSSSSILSLNLALTQSSSKILNKNNAEVNGNIFKLNNFTNPERYLKKDITQTSTNSTKSLDSSLIKNNKNSASLSVIQLYNELKLNQANKEYEKALFSTICPSLHTTSQTNFNASVLFSIKNNQENQIDKNYLTKQKNLNLSNKSSKKTKVIKLLSSSIEKRNARERTRVHTVNQAFYLLKNKLPSICSNTKRVSKLKILKAAINYIYSLDNIISFEPNVKQINKKICSTSDQQFHEEPTISFQSYIKNDIIQRCNSQKCVIESLNLNFEKTQESILQHFNNTNFNSSNNISHSSMFSNISTFNEHAATAASLLNNCNGYVNSLESSDINLNNNNNASSSTLKQEFIFNNFGPTTKLSNMSTESYIIDSN